MEDGIAVELKDIGRIREDDVYGGYRISMIAKFETINNPMSIDVTTGDVITPRAMKYDFQEMFGNESYSLWGYNIETIMAEKIETILSRSVFNTRPRDYYDAYILATTKEYNKQLLKDALKATAKHRGTLDRISDVEGILKSISQSKNLSALWKKYRKEYAYASEIDFSDIVGVLKSLLSE